MRSQEGELKLLSFESLQLAGKTVVFVYVVLFVYFCLQVECNDESDANKAFKEVREGVCVCVCVVIVLSLSAHLLMCVECFKV